TPTASQGAHRVPWILENILNTDSRENLSDPFANSGLPFPSLSRPCTGAEQSVDHAGPGALALHAPPRPLHAPAPPLPAPGPLGLCDVTGATGAPVRSGILQRLAWQAQDQGPPLGLVETSGKAKTVTTLESSWKGIHFQIFLVEIDAFSSSHRPRTLRTKQFQGASALTAQGGAQSLPQ
ncbi:hypothetical protein EI555_000891, partial [Monodon monoceros]